MHLFKENFNQYYEPFQLEDQLHQNSNVYWDWDKHQYYVDVINESKNTEFLHPEICSDNFQQVLDLHNAPKDCLLLVSLIRELNDIHQLRRLDTWMGYFLLELKHKPSVFYLMINSLLNQYCLNGYIHSQTTIEFQISKDWLSDFMQHNISFHEDYVANYLLNISLIIGSNAGIIKKSQKEVFTSYHNKKLTFFNITDFFNSIFTKFPIPKLFAKQLLQFEFHELKVIVQLLFGKNLRSCDNLPLSISRKESSVVTLQMKEVFWFETNKLKSILVLAKLISYADTYSKVALYHISRTNTFTLNLDSFIEDLNYWKSVYKFGVQINRDLLEEVRLDEFYEYFEMKKYEFNATYSFKGRTIKSLMREVIAERDKILYHQELELEWKSKYKTIAITDDNNDTYEFVELTTGKQLQEEGETMGHCVFRYYTHYCYKEGYSIISLRKIKNGKPHRLITISLFRNRLLEVKGKLNREPTMEENVILHKWYKRMDICTIKQF